MIEIDITGEVTKIIQLARSKRKRGEPRVHFNKIRLMVRDSECGRIYPIDTIDAGVQAKLAAMPIKIGASYRFRVSINSAWRHSGEHAMTVDLLVEDAELVADAPAPPADNMEK